MALQLENHPEFPSNYVQPRNVDVWLPPGYHSESDRKFGVLYMHDGQNLFNPQIAYTGIDWGVVPALKKLAAENAVPEVIIVGVWNTDKRVPEYLPQRPFETPKRRKLVARYAADIGDPPQSDDYLRFLVTELKPFVDGRYRTLADKTHTYIMGSSMGGLISLYALCEYPDLFGGAGCLSTHWPIVGDLMLDYLTAALPPPDGHRIYFDYGTTGVDAEYEPYQKEVDALMEAAGYTAGKDWVTRRFEGADHNEKAWRKRVHIPLEFLLGRR